VVGANWVGCHAADLLTTQGYSVTVIDTHESLGYDVGIQQGMVLRDRVANSCTIRLRTSVEEIAADTVTVWDSESGRRSEIPAVRVVIAARMEPARSLADQIRGRTGAQVHLIGDAVEPRKLADALLEGARLGQTL
jgi:NADPH-dependent 2,4-dienoyl-CoA reductase/sulfur reductase-like enzyme